MLLVQTIERGKNKKIVGAMVCEVMRAASSLQREIPHQPPDVGGSGGGVILRKSFIG